MADHLESGAAAERIARAHLAARGLAPVAENFRCRVGELDLVMLDGDTLVVVEVRYRRHTRVMNPCQSLTRDKLLRISRAARVFVYRHPCWRDHAVRFDVVGLHGPLEAAEMNWIRGAFTIDDLYDSRGP